VKRRRLEIYWNLPNLLADRKIEEVTELQTLLATYGVEYSYAGTRDLVCKQPLRVTMRTLLALCEILDCAVDDLIVIRPVREDPPQSSPAGTPLRRHPPELTGKRLYDDNDS
jgi:DNA-binding Xre family transcriptional regulator